MNQNEKEDIQDGINEKAGSIAEEHLLSSCVIIGVSQSEGETSHFAGYNGSLFEIIGALEQFKALALEGYYNSKNEEDEI